jgi:ribosomal protein L31
MLSGRNKKIMKIKNHPKTRYTTIILNNGASYQTQWIISNESQSIEMDPTNNILWKPYQDSSDLITTKRTSQFNERFGNFGLDFSSKV